MTALGVMASYVTTWPLLVLLGLGSLVSFFAFKSLRAVTGRRARILGGVLNGTALALYVLLIFGICWIYLTEMRVRFVVPEGYQGEVYVVHGVPGGVPEERSFFRTRTYRISSDGVLLSQVPVEGWTRPEYYYQSRDGKLTKIRYEWYSTIQRTPENLVNNRDVGMYFPRTASGGDSNSGCNGAADLFEIGTPAFLLSDHPEIDLSGYLAKHAAECVKH